LDDITQVVPGQDKLKPNVIDIHTSAVDVPTRLAANSREDRDAWIQAILDAKGVGIATSSSSSISESDKEESGAIECVRLGEGTAEVLPET